MNKVYHCMKKNSSDCVNVHRKSMNKTKTYKNFRRAVYIFIQSFPPGHGVGCCEISGTRIMKCTCSDNHPTADNCRKFGTGTYGGDEGEQQKDEAEPDLQLREGRVVRVELQVQ